MSEPTGSKTRPVNCSLCLRAEQEDGTGGCPGSALTSPSIAAARGCLCLARGSADNWTVHTEVYFNSLLSGCLQILFFFFPLPFFLRLLYGRIVVCPSMFTKTPQNSSCDQLLWKIQNMDYNTLTDCYRVYFPSASSNLR